MAREINLIVIHCSASPNGASLNQGEPGTPGFKSFVQVIDGWHKARGFHRNLEARKKFNPDLESIGYHYVIGTRGAVAAGRHEDEIGAHAEGYNSRSIGVCMVGIGKYSPDQWRSLKTIVISLLVKYRNARVVGHRDLSPDKNKDGRITSIDWLKTCPEFDVADWMARDKSPAPAHILEAAKP